MGLSRRELLGAIAAGPVLLGRAAKAALSYALTATPIADKTYVVYGAREIFTVRNGGNISNAFFIDTADGAVVIDTGSSRLYGEALRALAERTTGKTIVRVYITHHHPDHFLGNQAFEPETLASLEGVVDNIGAEGDGFAKNLYGLLGDWMTGTEATAPTVILGDAPERFGGHSFMPLSLGGHTSADMALLDEQTGLLFVGDVAFLDRALTTPHADIDRWRNALGDIERTGHKLLAQGHGPIEPGARALDQTRDYLDWLDMLLADAARDGLDATEAMALPIPDRFRSIALTREELRRSVAHLYRRYEETALPSLSEGSR